jgi:hypothetical protein
MKKLTKKSLIVLGLCTSLLSFAHDNHETYKEKEPKVTSMSFKSVKKGSKLLIKDKSGLVLYKESIVKTGKYSKGFDLTSLPNGDYYFELDTDLEIVIIPFNVVSNQVKFKKEEKSTVYKPVVRVKDELVYVSRHSFDESPIELEIFYSDNYDRIVSEKFAKETEVKRIYDFSTSKKGDYVFVFESNGRKFSKTIKM